MDNIRKSFIDGTKAVFIGTVYKSIVQAVQLYILIRLLDYSDFGLYAIALSIINFAKLYVDFGISNAIIHKKNLNDKILSSLFWLNITTGLLLSVIVFFISYFVGWFYKSIEIVYIIQLLSVTFLISSLGNIYRAILKKELKFILINYIDCICLTASFIIVIFLSYYKLGVISLAYGAIVSSVLCSFLLYIYGRKKIGISFYFNFVDIKEMVIFGVYQLSQNSIIYLNSQLDTILIGKFLGVESLGIYNIIKQLITMVSMAVSPVINNILFPILATINDNKTKIKEITFNTIKYTCVINLLFYSVLVINSHFIVTNILNVHVDNGVEIFSLISISYFIRTLSSPTGAYLLSVGRANIAFYWSLIEVILIPFFLFIGIRYNLYGVAFSLVFYQLIMFVINWFFIVKPHIGFDFYNYIICFLKPFLIMILLSIPCLAYYMFNETYNNIFIFLNTILIVIFYIILIVFFDIDLKKKLISLVEKLN